jgi:retinol dehydrogenase 12
MIKKIALVTGGTRGIGLEVVKGLLKKKYKLLVVGRNKDNIDKINKEIDFDDKIEFFYCDLSETNEIKELLIKLKKYNKIDLLINNAGALFANRENNSLGVEKTFALNHLSYFQITNGVLEQLSKSNHARIINVSSNMHRIFNLKLNDLENKKNYNGWRAYSNSKFLNILFTYHLSMKLKKEMVCNCLSPGFIDSNFGNNNKSTFRIFIKVIKKILAKSTVKGAETILYMALDESLSNINGKFFQNCKIKKTSKKTYDTELMKKVWDLSSNYLNT